MSMRRPLGLMALLCLTLAALQPARVLAQGASPDKYFPEGTDVVIQLNLSQLMGSNLLKKGIPLIVKKYGESVVGMGANFVPDENVKKRMQEMAPELKNMVSEEAVGQFMEMGKGFVKEFTMSMNTKEEVNGAPQMMMSLGIPMLTSATVEQFIPLLQRSGQLDIKSEEVGGITVYEVKPNTAPMAFYMAVPEDGLMVMGITKEVLTKSIKNKGKNAVDPKFKELLSQRKNSYTLFVAGLAPKNQADDFKHFVANLTVDNNINGNVMVACQDEEKAKAKAKEANEQFESMVATIVGFADDHAELKPLSESLKKVKAEVNGSNLTMKLSVNGDELIKAMKDAK